MLLQNRGVVSVGTNSVANGLQAILSSKQIQENAVDMVYGNSGKVTVYPTTEEEIARILKYANDSKKNIIVEGNGSKKGFGGQTEAYDICLSMRDYRGIVDHAVGDMTITVKAGTSFEEIQKHLKGFNQRISLDPITATSGTVGGIIAVNDSGPRRLSYGSARDVVIGMRVIYPDGTIVRCGGKVVKNVAGYDMNKLFIGSMGTLVVLSEITFKVKPTAKYESVVCLSFPDQQKKEIKDVAVKLLDSVMEPVSLQYISAGLSDKLIGQKKATLAVAFEDVESSVHYEEDFLKKITPQHVETSIRNQGDAEDFWQRVSSFYPSVQDESRAVALKIGVKNINVIEVMEKCDEISKGAVEVLGHGGIGHGLCEVYVKGAEEQTLQAIKEIREFVQTLGGYLVIKQAPLSVRKQTNVWPQEIGTQFLMEGIKQKCDPNGVLNVGRFVGGI